MTPLHDPAQERRRILADIQQLARNVARVVEGDIANLVQGIEVLGALRKTAYEDLNQLQHEALILEAAVMLEHELGATNIEWSWNPRQTGLLDEPDLRGAVNGETALSVEATASESPDGAIDTRMRHTLQKLSVMPGRKVYCVRTEAMRRRAQTKVCKAGYDIKVRLVT